MIMPNYLQCGKCGEVYKLVWEEAFPYRKIEDSAEIIAAKLSGKLRPPDITIICEHCVNEYFGDMKNNDKAVAGGSS